MKLSNKKILTEIQKLAKDLEKSGWINIQVQPLVFQYNGWTVMFFRNIVLANTLELKKIYSAEEYFSWEYENISQAAKKIKSVNP